MHGILHCIQYSHKCSQFAPSSTFLVVVCSLWVERKAALSPAFYRRRRWRDLLEHQTWSMRARWSRKRPGFCSQPTGPIDLLFTGSAHWHLDFKKRSRLEMYTGEESASWLEGYTIRWARQRSNLIYRKGPRTWLDSSTVSHINEKGAARDTEGPDPERRKARWLSCCGKPEKGDSERELMSNPHEIK